MDSHLARFIALRTVSLNDIRPQHTCGTEFSYLHKIIRADTEIEFNASFCFVNRRSGFYQSVHIFVTPSQGIS